MTIEPMTLETIRELFALNGDRISDTSFDGYYSVNGAIKHRSLRSITREAHSISKAVQKHSNRGVR